MILLPKSVARFLRLNSPYYFAPLIALAFPFHAGAQENTVTIPPGKSHDQLYLEEHPADTHFQADGVILYGGQSERFKAPPKFTLLSDPKRDPASKLGYPDTDLLESWEIPGEERYPLQLRNLRNPSLSGVTVIGLQSEKLPWRVIKAMWDGDAIHVKGCTGTAKISDVCFENVEDGFGPVEGLTSWSFKNAYMRSIRDDAIENDDLIPGKIENCLIDGCFVFLSQQPSSTPKKKPVTSIRNCIVHVQPQPHDGATGKSWRDRAIQIGEDGIGRAPGRLFKWSEGAGTVDIKDCIFRVDAISINGEGDMAFPPGRYENVTLVWLGDGAFPRSLPTGVKLTTDIRVFSLARREWIQNLPKNHPAAPLLE